MSRQNDLPTLDGAKESTTPSSSLYVDTENLQDASRTLVEAIVGSWPERAPPPSRLRLYVQADNVQLWEVWASDRFPQLTVVVHGVQHFTKQSKNAADMALALDAIADFVAGTTQFVVVMSDDSDFMSVFLKLRELANDPAPFLWVMTDRASTKTPVAAGYLPSRPSSILRGPLQRNRILRKPLTQDHPGIRSRALQAIRRDASRLVQGFRLSPRAGRTPLW